MKSGKSDPVREDDGAAGSRETSETAVGRSCSVRGNIYRWYPPLLVLSTVMAGVFCVLYVTKPVFLEAPNPRGSGQIGLPVHSGPIAGAERGGKQDFAAGILPVRLDPGLASLPGDPVAGAAPNRGVPPVAEPEPGAVPKASKPLFVPLAPDEMPAPAPGKAVAMEPDPNGPGRDFAPQDPEAVSAVAITIAEPGGDTPDEEGGDPGELPWEYLADRGDESENDPGKDPGRMIMHASVLGAFFAGDDEPRTDEKVEPDTTTAMRW